jgi:hypothetical protein
MELVKIPIEFSEKLSEKLIEEGMQKEVFTYINKLGFVSTIIKYIIDSRFRKGYNLRIWSVSQMNNSRLKKIVEKQGWSKLKSDDDKIKAILKYWKNGGEGGLRYKYDIDTFGAEEYWATIDEILDLLTDDCEGFANIIYHSAILAGIPSFRLFMVASFVKGGGHAYCVYRADNGLEYPIDGCYWENISLMMVIPYSMREEYFNGTSEWFRFNSDGMYVRKLR